LAQRFEPLITELFMLSIDLIKLAGVAGCFAADRAGGFDHDQVDCCYWCHFADGIVGR
jgi:hypothetical protein